MSRNFYRAGVALALFGAVGSAQAFTCSCASPLVRAAIRAHMQVDRIGYANEMRVLNLYLPQINDGLAKMYTSHEQQMAHESGMIDRQIHEFGQGLQEQAAAKSDGAAGRGVMMGVHPNACGTAQQAQRVGIALNTTAASGREMRRAARVSFNRIRNPKSEITMINALPERQRTAEMTVSDAGTMNDQQYVDAMKYREVILPTPPRSPNSLPDSAKSKPAARQYEEEFKKYEAITDLFSKMYNRDLQMQFRSIEANADSSQPTVESVWRDITSGGALADDMKGTSGDGASNYPDHWGGVVPATVNGKKYISERDYLRTEIFKRYANPKYESSPQYGLAAMGTPEQHMREIILQATLQNRMLYEIMNARLHRKMYLALKGQWTADAEYKPKLNQIATDAMR